MLDPKNYTKQDPYKYFLVFLRIRLFQRIVFASMKKHENLEFQLLRTLSFLSLQLHASKHLESVNLMLPWMQSHGILPIIRFPAWNSSKFMETL